MYNLSLLFKLFLPLLAVVWLQAAGTHHPDSFLWKAEKEGQSSYLLGSIHMADRSLFPLNPAIEAAYSSSDVLAVEVDMGKADDELPALIASHAFFSGENQLKTVLSPEHYTLMQKHLKKSGMDAASVERMKPWYLSLLFTNLSLQRIGANAYYGVDNYFISRAGTDKKEIIELEGAAYQIKKLDDLPMREQELLMVSSIVEDEGMEEAFRGMMRLWSAGDIPAMEKFINDSLAPYPELKTFNESFLTQRNRQMSDKIDTLIQSGRKVLVIIGVAHFLGEEGIIRLLEKKGYTVRQQ